MIKGNAGQHIEESIHQVMDQLRRSDLPMLEDIVQDIIATLSGRTSTYNRIPSSQDGACHDVLLAYCLGHRTFNTSRLDEISDHIAKKCPATRQVYLVTDNWNPSAWKKHENTFLSMRANVTILFYVLGRLVPLTP